MGFAAVFFFAILAIAGSASAEAPSSQDQTPQFQSDSSALTSAAQIRSETRAKALNSSIAACDCKIKPSSRAALLKPLGTTTVKDFKGREISVSVVSDEMALKIFQEMTSQGKIPFGFPEDGCFARAHEMAFQLEKKNIYTIKAIATGLFKLDNEKAKGGSVTWTWHIAPAVVVDNGNEKRIWVIDPSLFFEPAPLEKWLTELTKHPKAKLTSAYLTTRFVYHPNSRKRNLERFDMKEVNAARRVMKRYLKREKLRDDQQLEDL